MSVLMRLPLMVVLMAVASGSMLLPAIHALMLDQHRVAQPFFYAAILFGTLTALIGLATINNPTKNAARSQLITLVMAYALLPVILAVPMREAIGDASFFNVYFEMVSSFTTTGASVFEIDGRLSDPLHLWRVIVGWMGGFFILLMGIAVMAPLNIGGFEVLRAGLRADANTERMIRAANMSERLVRYCEKLLPLYIGATFVLWLALILSGTRAFTALCVAMSTLSTSGIMPTEGSTTLNLGLLPEVLIFVFLIAAVTRQSFSDDFRVSYLKGLQLDRELRLAFWVVISLTLALFLRHWVGAFDVNEQDNYTAGIAALWGALFTVFSFLTTTGFISSEWSTAQSWSALSTPGLIFAGLAILGGGVATTAGGVKLLRVYALYKNGVRELEQLIHPSSVGHAGWMGRELRRDGAFVAWIFFMLFALSVAAVIIMLTATGIGFEAAVGFAIAALSTTGPLAEMVGQDGISYATLPVAPKIILIFAMILGRLETLAFIALFNPDFWRN